MSSAVGRGGVQVGHKRSARLRALLDVLMQQPVRMSVETPASAARTNTPPRSCGADLAMSQDIGGS